MCCREGVLSSARVLLLVILLCNISSLLQLYGSSYDTTLLTARFITVYCCVLCHVQFTVLCDTQYHTSHHTHTHDV